MSNATERPLKQVTIYTDGGADPNPGPGGYGVVLKYGPHRRELSGGYVLTTNNRMELMAAIVGLETLKERCAVTLHSDSQYLIKSVNSGAAFTWRDNNWWRSGTGRAKNADLWQRFLEAHARHTVTLVWVKGHAGVADNETCDRLAMSAAKRPDRAVDHGYLAALEEEKTSPPPLAEGHPCRRCRTPLVKQLPKKLKRRRRHHFEWYLYCPGCQATYQVEEAKRVRDGELDGGLSLFTHENANG